MLSEYDLIKILKAKGAEFIHFVNISHLPGQQTNGFKNAILFGIPLTPRYIKKVSNTPDYVRDMIEKNLIRNDEFHLTEQKTDRIADEIVDYLRSSGYSAYSQSENNIYRSGHYNEKEKITPLPHKTIALLAGIGWIGKHNLLVTSEYGSAISMCSVLTDAPLRVENKIIPKSKCGDCNICINVCSENALTGKNWTIKTGRNNLLDVKKCTTCLKCMVICLWSQTYMKNYL